jgi:hypothetical protein
LTQVITSERSSLSARSTSETCPPTVRARIASRAPRGSCACTANSRRVASSGPPAGGPPRPWAASRRASTDASLNLADSRPRPAGPRPD